MTISAEKYTEGLCSDGAAILCDGVPMSISEILVALQSGSIAKGELLAVREAQPVAWTVQSQVNALRKGSPGIMWPQEMFTNSASVRSFTSPPAPAVPDGVMPDGIVYSSALPEFENNDSDKVVGYHCLIHGKTRSVDSQEQAYADAELVVNACRAAMLNHAGDDNKKVEPVSQGYTFDGLNIRAVAALRESVRNQWLKSDDFAEKVYWQSMHSIANEVIAAMQVNDVTDGKPVTSNSPVIPDGWIEHDGNGYPTSVKRDAMLYLKTRKQEIKFPYPAGIVKGWSHFGSDTDIIAYKLAAAPTPTSE